MQHQPLGYIPPNVIQQYMHQWITTSIQGYGHVIAYVADYNSSTGMVSLIIYPTPSYEPQYIQVHYSDLVGVSPYFGPTPPHPHQPWHPHHHHHHHHPWGPWNPWGATPPQGSGHGQVNPYSPSHGHTGAPWIGHPLGQNLGSGHE